jgi:nucleoside-diphosphate-sugar epimerase
MKFFVTGATGFIGSRVAKLLLEQGHIVNSLVRSPKKAQSLRNMGALLFEGDITDKESMRKPMKDVDGIFHIAALYKLGIKDKKEAELINVTGTKNVLELMKEYTIKKGVYTSTLAVYSDTKDRMVDESYYFSGKHISVYDKTKWRAHYLVAQQMINDGLPLVIVLPGVVYGPGDTSAIGSSLKEYLQGKLSMLPKKNIYCWAHVEDIAFGHILAMEKGVPGQSYIIAGPRHSIEEAFVLAEKITGIQAPKNRLGPSTLKLLSNIVKVIELFKHIEGAYSSEGLRAIAGTTYLGSNLKATNQLGYRVRPLEEGLKETLNAMMKEMNIKKSNIK